MSKLVSVQAAMAGIPDGALLALGGNTLNRAPLQAVMEVARQGRKGLRLIKTAGGLDIDLLCLAGCVSSVDAGFVSHETQFSLCRNYRRAVEQGSVKAYEHACYTVISALRAASYGLPFLPVKGLMESDLPQANPRFSRVKDPFSGEELAAVCALAPDAALLHVHQADENGNAFIDGPVYEDVLMSRAAKKVIITCEEVVEKGAFTRQGIKAQIPGFMVESVALVPRGAAPGAMHGRYPVEETDMRAYLRLNGPEELAGYLTGRREAFV